MKIVIAGAGEVGSHLAKLLSKEEQDITVIDPDASKLSNLDSNYNLLTFQGSAVSFADLQQSNVSGCDLFIAVTPIEADNLIACSMAKSLKAKKTVARIDNYEYKNPTHREFFSSLGIDDLIYPESLASAEIVTALEHNWARQWLELHHGELIMVGVKLREGAELTGLQLKELAMRIHAFHVAAIRRNHETIIPRGNDRLLDGDIVYFITTRQYVTELADMCGKRQHKIKNVMIMGGSRIAVRLAFMASDKFHFKIVERDRLRCMEISEYCPKADIICGDARDMETLSEEGISEIDAFVALTDNSEANILTCMAAKDAGVIKTVAEVENIQYISTAEGLNIGTVINKKLLASSRIFQILLDADTETSKCLALADAEVAEIEVKTGSKITRAPVRDLHLSSDMTIAGMLRHGKGMLVTGNTTIEPGDRVLVFCLNGVIRSVEKLFS